MRLKSALRRGVAAAVIAGIVVSSGIPAYAKTWDIASGDITVKGASDESGNYNNVKQGEKDFEKDEGETVITGESDKNTVTIDTSKGNVDVTFDDLKIDISGKKEGDGSGKTEVYIRLIRRALELGIRRKRYLIPPTQYEDGREDAPTLLRRAMADYRRGEAELPGLVNGIFLGDRVQFDTGREWLVIRVRWKQSGSTARTHLELADPTYADLYG